MKKTIFLLTLPLFLFVAGCKTQNGYAPGSDAGYAVGKVLDMRGNPIPDAVISATSTLSDHKRLVGTTDTNGNYRIKIPAGAWKMSAELERIYHGRRFQLMLHPDHPEVFTGQDGVVCNFEWRLYGPKANQPNQYYGGEVKITQNESSQITDIENIAFTFTPISPRIDGSTAQPETVHCGPRGTDEFARFPDIPIGQYKITALYQPSGQRIYLRNNTGGTYSTDGSVVAEFNGTAPASSRINGMILEFKEQN
ncbi:carboxypeptidase-like regulatory domain-containing protein [Spirosoma oryzicola]|uniref:carboxypeptidase-like regulatory domain-containing protein n=1 Tax=Spirosoma oryzicola TaxID=2898794 RepID=UPI001E3ABB1E|nr:carboxypeptidase-like regulatory domain-containing protein [Spirosoma oryzicola]UHG92274.1 carboxypeptidase-like regulatory domain-containing protein [Spirosoma oryzicola]